MKKQQTGDR